LAPLLARGAQRRALLGLWGGAIVGLALVTFSLPDAEEFSIARYGFAFVAAFAVASGLAAADRVAASPSRRDFVVVAVTLFAVTLQIHDTRAAAARNLGVALDRMTGADPNHPPLQTAAATVTAMQRAVPAGAPLLVMIERPYLLDYDRNPITHLDQPGAASPPPGIPLAAGGESVARYLLAAQIRYFAFTRPDRAEIDIYRRAHWQRMLTGRTRIWRLAAPSFLATFDAIDELARTRRALYDDGHLIVVDLAS
jgi:hypothetical protein